MAGGIWVTTPGYICMIYIYIFTYKYKYMYIYMYVNLCGISRIYYLT